MFKDRDAVEVPTSLLDDAHFWAPKVGFLFHEYEEGYLYNQGPYPGTRDAAFLDWLGLHLFVEAEQAGGYPESLPAEWPTELQEFFWRLEARNVAWMRHIDGPRKRRDR